jgi:cytidine deaminase
MNKEEMVVKCEVALIKSQDLNEGEAELLRKAHEAASNAYAPYSGFHVGAAVRLKSGTIVLGNNQENIAYPSGLCGERVAVFAAGAQFPRNRVDCHCLSITTCRA